MPGYSAFGRGMTGKEQMTEFFLFIYTMLTIFIIVSMRRNQRAQRRSPQMMVMVGWGLFSLSSTLAVLLGTMGLALALGMHVPLPAEMNAPIF
jgi:hypothetical protein